MCPPHKICPKIACRIICEGPHCAGDFDCHLESNYCNGCNCEALTANEHGAQCGQNQQVQCFVDPCFNKIATCDPTTHRCVAVVP